MNYQSTSRIALSVLATLTFAMATGSANAATYNIDESFTGTFSLTDLGNGTGHIDHALNFSSLLTGDSSIFSSAVSSYVSYSTLPTFQLCTSGCSFTETLKNGDSLFGTVAFTTPPGTPDATNNFTTSFGANITITGGSGLFAGATGSGVATGSDVWTSATGGTSIQHTVAILTTPVPEPETYAMMLAGLGIMGFMVRRRRNEEV
jgi:hypothetical protein